MYLKDPQPGSGKWSRGTRLGLLTGKLNLRENLTLRRTGKAKLGVKFAMHNIRVDKDVFNALYSEWVNILYFKYISYGNT